MKKVLVITYYWPPSAGSGVQRWLKFVKYLPEYGWKPIVFTPLDPDFDIVDEKLLKDVPQEATIIKKPIWEPYFFLKFFSKKAHSSGIVHGQKKAGFLSFILNWIRGNCFIPDPKIFWRRPAVKFLKNYLKSNPVDLIISTGTPHSMHLIALDIKNELGIPWISDFRDPWSKLDMLENYHISKRNFSKYQLLEKKVLAQSNLTLTTSEIWKDEFKKLGAKNAVCITNGFDEADFDYQVEPYEDFVISHFGLLNHLRNPQNLWLALEQLCSEDQVFAKRLKIHLGGNIDANNLEYLESSPILSKSLVLFKYLNHEEVLQEYLKSSVLLLLLFNSSSGIGNIPGKIFEYLAANKPILAFGPGSGDAESIMSKSGHPHYFSYSSSVTELKQAIQDVYKAYDKGEPLKPNAVRAYSRKFLTGRLVDEMNKLL